MKKIIAFAGSNSKQSINKALVEYASSLVKGVEVEVLDLNDYVMPIYSIDIENEKGIPEKAIEFKNKIRTADGIIISFAEHNGAYSVAFKNVYDWISRIESDVWLNKPMLMLGTSPGGRGAKGVLDLAKSRFERGNENLLDYFSFPSFQKNFDSENGIVDASLKEELMKRIDEFESLLNK